MTCGHLPSPSRRGTAEVQVLPLDGEGAERSEADEVKIGKFQPLCQLSADPLTPVQAPALPARGRDYGSTPNVLTSL